MKAPSAKRLLATFPHLEPKQVNLIRRLCELADSRDMLGAHLEKHCPATAAYRLQCYHDPLDSYTWRRTLVLHAIDRVLGTHGVEALGEVDMHDGPPFEYCNAGDPYVATLVYCRDADALRIGCWGDYAEAMEGAS